MLSLEKSGCPAPRGANVTSLSLSLCSPLSTCVWGLDTEERTGPSDQGAIGEQEMAVASDFCRIRIPRCVVEAGGFQCVALHTVRGVSEYP